jgi:drug/metabolite transporter (DMT)-like permease
MNKHFLPILALVLMTLIWSYNWTVMKAVLHYITAFEFSALRSVFGAGILFAVLRATNRSLAMPPLLPTIAVGILQTAGMTSLCQLALLFGGVGTTAVLTYSMPFWVIIFAAIFLKERTSGLHKVAFAVAGVGFIFIISPWNVQGGTMLSFVLATLSGVTWAIGTIVFKRLSKRDDIELLNFTTWQMLFGAVALSIVAVATHSQPIVWDRVWSGLAYNAVLSTALAWVLWLYILKSLPTGVAGLSTLLVPIVSIFFAWLRLGEVPHSTEMLGIMLISFALLLISLPGLLHTVKLHHAKRHV